MPRVFFVFFISGSFLCLLPSGSCFVYDLIVKDQSETKLKKMAEEGNRKKSFIEMKKFKGVFLDTR